MRSASAIALILLMAGSVAAPEASAILRNWFDDPFFQVTSADPTCPLPAGPYVDERGRHEQAHRRAEKGTTCWLAGQCDRPKAYLYDKDIAAGVRQAFAATDRFNATTLWITVQGRVVYVEGCAAALDDAQAAETLVRSLPFVEQALAIMRIGSSGTVPYRVRPTR